MARSKLKDRQMLVKYINSKRGGLKYLTLMEMGMSMSMKRYEQIIDEIDALERMLAYIDKVMLKTPEFKKYLALSRRMSDSEILKKEDNNIKTRELNEEVFYIICHIEWKEAQIERELTN